MRVTHIITRLIVGGAQENTVDSVLGLRGKPHLDVDLISGPTAGQEGSLEPAFAGAPQALEVAPHLVRPVHPWLDLRALLELTRMLRRRRPDLVHTHSGKAGILGRMAARRAGVPLIVHTIHGPSFGRFQGPLANRIFRAAELRAAAYTTHFVSVAHAMTRQYLQAGIGCPEQFTRIVSGFRLEPFLAAAPDPALRARLGLAPGDFVVGKLARIAPLKGHDELLAAAPPLLQRHPQLKFLLVGDGPARAGLEREIHARGWSGRFVLAGLVPPPQIPALLGIMDVVVHLSRREGLPRAISQALAAAKPVIAYDCDGAGEVCLPDRTGFLVQPGNLEELRRRLEQLMADRSLGERLGGQGRDLVRQDFTVDRMVNDLDALYQRLAGEHGAGRRPASTFCHSGS